MTTQVAPIGKPNYIESYFTDGLFGNLIIEIIGHKDRAVLTVEDLRPCYLNNDRKIGICFKEGILSTEYNRIPVHSSGVKEVEFNRIENKEKIAKLTEQIESYGNSSTPEETTILEKLFIQRYRLYAENEDYEPAIQNLESAIAIMPIGFNESSSYKDLEETEKDNVRRFDRYQYWLAEAYYNSEQFDKAAALFEQSLNAELSRGLNQIFDWQQLEL